jgi:hypothetical protein
LVDGNAAIDGSDAHGVEQQLELLEAIANRVC